MLTCDVCGTQDTVKRSVLVNLTFRLEDDTMPTLTRRFVIDVCDSCLEKLSSGFSFELLKSAKGNQS